MLNQVVLKRCILFGSFESVYVVIHKGKASCKSQVNFKNKYSLNCSLMFKYYFNAIVNSNDNEKYFYSYSGRLWQARLMPLLR